MLYEARQECLLWNRRTNSVGVIWGVVGLQDGSPIKWQWRRRSPPLPFAFSDHLTCNVLRILLKPSIKATRRFITPAVVPLAVVNKASVFPSAQHLALRRLPRRRRRRVWLQTLKRRPQPPPSSHDTIPKTNMDGNDVLKRRRTWTTSIHSRLLFLLHRSALASFHDLRLTFTTPARACKTTIMNQLLSICPLPANHYSLKQLPLARLYTFELHPSFFSPERV